MRPQFHLPLSTYPEASSFAIIENAIQFCLHHEADLVASLSVARRPGHPLEPSEDSVDDDTLQADRFDREIAAQLVRHLKHRSARVSLDVRLDTFDAEAMSASLKLAELSRAYDLTIVENSEIARPTIESLVFESGRPLLLLPPEDFYGRIDTVCIAWDGSATVAHALSTAYSLIGSATKAIVACVRNGELSHDKLLDRYVEALKHSGLEVELAALHCDGEDIPSAIQDGALEGRADLLIAGAYGHSKLREAMFGGVTRGLLDNLRVPVLLAH